MKLNASVDAAVQPSVGVNVTSPEIVGVGVSVAVMAIPVTVGVFEGIAAWVGVNVFVGMGGVFVGVSVDVGAGMQQIST